MNPVNNLLQSFWKRIAEFPVRSLFFTAGLLLLSVLGWWVRQELEAAGRTLPTAAANTEPLPAEPSAVQPRLAIPPEALKTDPAANPFNSGVLIEKRELHRRKIEEEARRRAEEEARRRAEEEARRKAEDEARRKAEDEARLKTEETARIKAEAAQKAAPPPPPPPPPKRKLTLTYHGLLVRPDGTRFALLQMDEKPAQYLPTGTKIEWFETSEIARGTLQIKVGDQIITLDRSKPLVLEEP